MPEDACTVNGIGIVGDVREYILFKRKIHRNYEIDSESMHREKGQDYDSMKVKVKVAQSWPTLCNPMDIVHGILHDYMTFW